LFYKTNIIKIKIDGFTLQNLYGIVKQLFKKMEAGTIGKLRFALDSFMSRGEEAMPSQNSGQSNGSIVHPQLKETVVGPPVYHATAGTSPNLVGTTMSSAEMAFPVKDYNALLSFPKKSGSLTHPKESRVNVQPLQPPPTHLELVQDSVSKLIHKPIRVDHFCNGLASLGFSDVAIMNLLQKMGLICQKNSHVMIDNVEMKRNLNQFIESLVQMKNIVNFVVAIIEKLRESPVVWAMLRNPSLSEYIWTTLEKEFVKKVRAFLTSIGFPSENSCIMTVPSSLASLSPTDLLEEIWRVVSAYDWESAPQKSAQGKRGRDDSSIVLVSLQQNSAKRVCDSSSPVIKNKSANLGILLTLVRNLAFTLLAGHGVSSVYLMDVVIGLEPKLMRKAVVFLSNTDNFWRFHRALMEIVGLAVESHSDGLIRLSIDERFNWYSFVTTVSELFKSFEHELVMMHQIAGQACHEAQKLAEDKKKQLEDFITSLWNLEKTGKMKAFLKRLCDICPIFDSPSTNFDLLKLAALHFVESVYNPSTSAYYDSTPCPDPLKAFIEHATTRFGVFTPKLPLCRYDITVCNHEFKSCPFGKNCRSVHSDYFSRRWIPKDRSSCCSDYGNRGFCGNQECSLVHANIVEFNRAVNAGAGDSKIELFKRIERECSIRIKTVHN
jgi:hypothetical protein